MPRLDVLEARLAALIAQTEPAERRTLARELARRLRERQRQRIGAQVNPDGTPFEPRKSRLDGLRNGRLRALIQWKNKGAIRRRMFARLATARYLKAESSADSARVVFTEAASRIATIHQFGLRDRVERRRDSPEVRYPARRLLGLSEEDEQGLHELILMHLSK
ncbi:phage virion morphogenesis protein [Uliginosibacterium paludis]|uniref:Phage virion morphogenesis protein n=1 Tax=Uliginosibacterium paludis TaxID=1615952 RepID=A0ABV2CW11_9RHOO